MNAILAAAGHNLRIIRRMLRLSWLYFWLELLRDPRLTTPASGAA
jgi:hypothetical protein